MAPKNADPFLGIGRYQASAEQAYQNHFELSTRYYLKQMLGEGDVKRTWLVSPSGEALYPSGWQKLNLVSLNVMGNYAQERKPYANGVIYSFEKEFDRYLDRDFSKQLPKLDSKVVALQLDLDLPFNLNSLDRVLQLDSKNPTYIYTENWLYKERKSNSLLSINNREREKYLSALISNYYSLAVPKVRAKYPGIMIFSQPFSQTELDLKPLMELTAQYCDVLVVRYPGKKGLKPSDILEFISKLEKPIYFIDVPLDESSKTIFPLLSSPRVIGWKWVGEGSDPVWTSQFPKLIHYLDANGLPSNF